MIEEHIYNWDVPCTTNKSQTDFFNRNCEITVSGVRIDHVVKCVTGYFGNIVALVLDNNGKYIIGPDGNLERILLLGDVRISIEGELQP